MRKDYNPDFHGLVFLQYSQQEIFKKKHFKLFVWSCGGVATIVFPPESHFLHFPKNIHLPAPLYKHLTNVELNFVDFGTWPYLLSSMDRSIFLALDIRVFRFSSKSEYCFKAWGVHADRYDRATDQQKNYRPINDILPAPFVFNGKWSFWPFSGMSEITKNYHLKWVQCTKPSRGTPGIGEMSYNQIDHI